LPQWRRHRGFMLYPITFSPIYKDIIWGGTNIRSRFNRITPFERVAESWELSCRNDGMSIAANGALSGKSIQNLINEFGDELVGTRSIKKCASTFPLLIKLIDAADRLSVQVHPTDEYAQRDGEANGKNEMWYVIDAKENAKLVYGLKPNVTKQDFKNAVAKNQVSETLNEVPVKPGDFFFIPAGTVHAILDGILVAEIQQNSNTTYRIYDWGRLDANGKGRETHIEKALDVINFGPAPYLSKGTESFDYKDYAIRKLLRSEYFNLDEININSNYNGKTSGETFIAAMIIDGNGALEYDNGILETAPGKTILIPASLGNFEFTGRQKLLLTEI
jgi:mannose-6-phosphate isomerase